MNKKGDIGFFVVMTALVIIVAIIMLNNEPTNKCTEPVTKHCYRESSIHSQIETSCNNVHDYYYNITGEGRTDCIRQRVKGFD